MRRNVGWKVEWKISLSRYRRRWEDNINMDLRDMGFGDADWVHLAQDVVCWQAFVNMVMNLLVL
jgi:hypothetical protein